MFTYLLLNNQQPNFMALATLINLHMMLHDRNVEQLGWFAILGAISIRCGHQLAARQVCAYDSCGLCRISCYRSFTSHHFSQLGHPALPLCEALKDLGHLPGGQFPRQSDPRREKKGVTFFF